MEEKIRLCCPCHFGLERTLKFEIGQLGGEDLQVEDGRIHFTGTYATLAAANICLSTAERVLVELGSYTATTYEALFDGMEKLPLEKWIGPEDAFPVKGHTLDSKLHSVPDCQSILKKAAVRRLEKAYHQTWFPETGPKHALQFQLRKNKVTIYLDTSGAGLHKRGYRCQGGGVAPLKETLAAGIVDIARVKADSVVCDPLCGSGTILIEAAMKACRVAPGLHRHFQAEQWAQVPKHVWAEAREEARSKIRRDTAFVAYGSDIDAEAIALAEENCRRAGVAGRVRLKQADVQDFQPPEGGAITICNPPYGERLMDMQQAQAIYRVLGDVFPANKKNPAYILSPDPDFALHFGREPDKRRKLYNGMIMCYLMEYYQDPA